VDQLNDQLVIGVVQVKTQMNGLWTRQIVTGSVTKLQLVGELASCMNDHSRNRIRDGD